MDQQKQYDREVLKEAKKFENSEVTKFHKCIRYSFLDVISFSFNKPNLAIGGPLWYSVVHFFLLVLGIFFIIFMTEEREAWGCYAPLYGKDFSIKKLDQGLCTLKTPPNIGSKGYGDQPITNRVYGFIITGGILLSVVLIGYIYIYFKIEHTDHVTIQDDTYAVAKILAEDKEELKEMIHPVHWWQKKKEFHYFHFQTIYWWYFDVFAYFLNVPNQVQDGLFWVTFTRIFLNTWSFIIWPWIYMLFLDNHSNAFYQTFIWVPQAVSLCMYLAGMLEMHIWLQRVRYRLIQQELKTRYGQIKDMDKDSSDYLFNIKDIKAAFSKAKLQRKL